MSGGEALLLWSLRLLPWLLALLLWWRFKLAGGCVFVLLALALFVTLFLVVRIALFRGPRRGDAT